MSIVSESGVHVLHLSDFIFVLRGSFLTFWVRGLGTSPNVPKYDLKINIKILFFIFSYSLNLIDADRHTVDV